VLYPRPLTTSSFNLLGDGKADEGPSISDPICSQTLCHCVSVRPSILEVNQGCAFVAKAARCRSPNKCLINP
jgi:hypothetical protein